MPGPLGYRVPVVDRFMAKARKRADGCWEWTGTRGHEYGYLWIEGKMVRAHRVAYELFVGPVPADLFVLHSCDRPWCVNPSHLRVGTGSDNARDCVDRGRHGNQWRRNLEMSK